jgi:hypothetical protein
MSEIETWLDVLGSIPCNLSQRQDSTIDQLCDLILFANKLGFYDAADYLKAIVKGGRQ